jgi:hypothetical protein
MRVYEFKSKAISNEYNNISDQWDCIIHMLIFFVVEIYYGFVQCFEFKASNINITNAKI